MKNLLDFCKAPEAIRKKNYDSWFLLFIDTPGNTAFMNLRKRGGAVADIAILVIEIFTGPLNTTWEAVRMLRDRKVPFVITGNKMDRTDGWKSIPDADFKVTYESQPKFTQELLDKYIYTLQGLFFEEGFKGIERYDKISDFTQNVAIVPCSAKSGEGIPSLLMVLVGLCQQYLQKNIKYTDGRQRSGFRSEKGDRVRYHDGFDQYLMGIFRKHSKLWLVE